MNDTHEHVCSCGQRFPITDADALKRQSGIPQMVQVNTAGAVPLQSTSFSHSDWTGAAANPIPAYTIRIPT